MRIQTIHSNELRSKKLRGKRNPRRVDIQKMCERCGNVIALTGATQYYKFCSNNCRSEGRQESGRNTGRLNVTRINKRSKNEILFASLCVELGEIRTNDPMFNGWDADVILPTYKVAVMWNGPWHYRKITKAHSLEQVQNRDIIKQQEIKKAGFEVYVVRDNGSHNPKFVVQEYEKFKRWISEVAITRLS